MLPPARVSSMLPPARVKILSKQNHKLCCYSGISVRCSCTHGIWKAGASGTDAVRELFLGSTAIWFLGSVHATSYFYDDNDVSQLSAMTTLLRRRHGRSVKFIHRCCWVSVSISSIYLLVLFLPVLQYACLDVLQSSFKYACLECVTFKLSICVYAIIMLNNFLIKIVRKLSKFLTEASAESFIYIYRTKIITWVDSKSKNKKEIKKQL
jgi:hypothetical protein